MPIGSMIGKAIVKDVAKNEVNKAVGVNLLKSRTSQASGAYGAVNANKNAPMVERNKPPKPPRIPKMASVNQTFRDMEELEKAADGWRDAARNAVAMSAATVGTALAFRGAGNMYKKLKTERIWQKLKKENPNLGQAPKAREHFEVLQQFSPDIASNITTARSYMERMQSMGMVPHEFVGDLAKTQDVRHRMGVGRLVEDAAQKGVGHGLSYTQMQQQQRQHTETHQQRGQQFDATHLQRGSQFDATHKQKDRHFDATHKQRGSQFGKTFKQKDDHFGKTFKQKDTQFGKTFKQKAVQFGLSFGQKDKQFKAKTKLDREKLMLSRTKTNLDLAKHYGEPGVPIGSYMTDLAQKMDEIYE